MDPELVTRAQRGDEDAFGQLATAMFARLHRVAENILGDRDLAEDAAQQGVVQMWRNLPKLRDPERFESWSYRIVVNACYAEAKKAKRWRSGLSDRPEDDPGATAEFTGVVYRDQLERGFRRLPVEQRAVLVLYHYVGLTLAEIASTLKIPSGTAHSRLYKGRHALRASLQADDRDALPDASANEVVR